ncbi:MAG TPA: putative Ig domain-containing protein [Candidatus Acidoferrum sp.]|nr:putative Ig domain-containing protein [Candidatus Acidoferrum sp.]
MSGSGTISGTATGPNGPVAFTIKVTDSSTVSPQFSSASFTITVNLPTPPAFTTASPLPPGTEFVSYSQTLAASGYGPFTYAVAAGSNLPAGLSLSTAGVITGQPTGPAGTDPFSLTVTDNSKPAQSTTQAFSMVVSEPTAPTVTTTSPLPNGTTGVLYNLTLGVTGGHAPFTWAQVPGSGTLPPPLTLIPGNGQISFTPTTTGVYTFKVQVTDSSNPAQTAPSALLSLTITAGPLAVTPQTLPTGAVGEAYPATTIGATGGVPPYTFSVISAAGTFPPGLTLNSNGSITNSPSPTTASTYNFTAQVKDSTNATAPGNFSIVINPALTISTPSTLPPGTQGASYSYNLAASGGLGSYTWSLASGSNPLPTGLALSPTGQIAGTPTATGTFPFTVQVKDSIGGTAQANLSITVNAVTCGSGSESLLDAGYAFVLKGFDCSGNPAIVGGVLTFNGTDGDGLITAGTMDVNLNAGVQTLLNVTSGTYSVGSDHRGCMAITSSLGTQNYRFSVGNITSGVAATAHVIDFDTTGPFVTGTMRKQTGGPFSTSLVTGSYAFGGSSIQNAVVCNNSICGGKFGYVGILDFNGGGGITSGSEDINQNGVLDGDTSLTSWPATSPITFNSATSSYTIATNGRGTLTIGIVGVPTPSHSVLYAVSLSDALFMSSDPQTANNVSAGEAIQQTGAPFSANPLSGTYIGYDSGLGSSSTGRTDMYLLGPMTSGTATIAGTQFRNDGGTFSSQSLAGASYSVASTGRMLVLGTGTHAPVLYLVSSTEAFYLNGNGGVDSGVFQLQSGSPFTDSSASGTYAYGVIDPEYANTGVNSGVATFATPNLNVIEDDNSNGSQTVGGTQAFTYSVDATGLGEIPSSGSSCTVSASSTTCQTLFYIISPTKAVVMDATSNNPKITLADK